MARRAIAVLGVCGVMLALPVGSAQAQAASVVTVTDCGGGLTITLGGGSLLNVNLPGADQCPSDTPTPSPSASPTMTPTATPSYPTCTLPPPPTTPAPSPSRSRTPAVKPTPSQVAALPAPQAPQPVPTPPAPSPTPTTPTPSPSPKPTPTAAASTELIVPSATTFHTAPFKPLSTVLVVFLIAVVPVSIARARHRRR